MWYTLFEIEISRKTCAMLLIVKCLLFMVFYFPFIYQKVGFAHAYFFVYIFINMVINMLTRMFGYSIIDL